MQTSTVVKTHPILKYVALGVSIALVVVACTITQKHAPGVSIHETFVEIYPGTKISRDDQKALDAVLKNFNKSIYKIRTYDGGKLVKTQGSLADARIDQTLVANAVSASQKGVSHSALEVGLPYYALWRQTTQGIPNHSQVSHVALWRQTTKSELQDSERLVSRVAPILQKYSQ